MRYQANHKMAMRNRILKIASRLFRRAGSDAISVADIMGAANLTRGGFYLYFSSKEELFTEALVWAIQNTGEQLKMAAEVNNGGLAAIVAEYFQLDFRSPKEDGCVASMLAADIARHPTKTREAFERQFENTISTIAGYVRGADPENRRQTAIGIFSIMTGAMQLARVVSDQRISDLILSSAKAEAIASEEVNFAVINK